MDLLRGIILGFVLLSLVIIGSCTVGTAFVVEKAATVVGGEVGKSDNRLYDYAEGVEGRLYEKVDEVEMDHWNEADVDVDNVTDYVDDENY